MYIKTSNNVIDFPFSIAKLKRENPNISFPKTLSDSQLEEFEVYPVIVNIPEMSASQALGVLTFPELVEGVWEVTYTVINLPPEEVLAKAKSLRDQEIVADIFVHEVSWQVDDRGRDNMRNAIETAHRKELPVDTTQAWILSDNSIRYTTVAELEEVLNQYTLRIGEIFMSYTLWRSGDKLLPFSI